ncbi:hypothetical protein CCH79_00009122 [Gambusia affinis]|uniref:RZZ complex subunit KNTC1/ROD C-terminal domain-containing protein n=1 Tax=Gambusia affinis TaxID=33528 RepID=A0A315UWF5_GAMAF|nr:hypothetical protein CCH79_00009122 [Gambusia affinis]
MLNLPCPCICFLQISHLQMVLEAIVAVPTLWEISSFSRTWRSMILAPFVSASVPLSPDQQAMLYRTFVLLLKCPFLLNLDLIGIANRFAQFNLHAFALGTLLLIPCANKKAQQIQGFLSMCNPVAVLEQVDEFMDTGELAGIPSQIRETVLKFISQNGQHQKVVKTKHFAHLKQLVVSSGQPNQLKELVECLISQNWMMLIRSLVHLYHQTVQRCVGNKPNFMLHLFVFQDFLSTTNGFNHVGKVSPSLLSTQRENGEAKVHPRSLLSLNLTVVNEINNPTHLAGDFSLCRPGVTHWKCVSLPQSRLFLPRMGDIGTTSFESELLSLYNKRCTESLAEFYLCLWLMQLLTKRDFNEISGNQITKHNRRWIASTKSFLFFLRDPLRSLTVCMFLLNLGALTKH